MPSWGKLSTSTVSTPVHQQQVHSVPDHWMEDIRGTLSSLVTQQRALGISALGFMDTSPEGLMGRYTEGIPPAKGLRCTPLMMGATRGASTR